MTTFTFKIGEWLRSTDSWDAGIVTGMKLIGGEPYYELGNSWLAEWLLVADPEMAAYMHALPALSNAELASHSLKLNEDLKDDDYRAYVKLNAVLNELGRECNSPEGVATALEAMVRNDADLEASSLRIVQGAIDSLRKMAGPSLAIAT